MGETTEIRPQEKQELFLATPADIAIYGGAAGGGKTWGLLLEPLRHVYNKDFGAVIFRRTYPQVTAEGGMWDDSQKIYPLLGAKPKETTLEWEFPSGARIRFAHMQYEKNRLDWQGAQIPLIEFDELTHFTHQQFFYMLSRNRSTCGVRPYIRAATNPDAESWLVDLISWWIGDNGFPISERTGRLRWLVRVGDELKWYNSAAEAHATHPDIPPKSVTFIPAKVYDNPALLKADPGYLANLMALPLVDRERLLGGNWKIRAAGKVFNPEWFRIVDAVPFVMTKVVRYWDKAATEDGGSFTAGVLIGLYAGRFYVIDVVRGQWTAGTREQQIKNAAYMDQQRWGDAYEIWIEQEPGSGGKESAQSTIRNLAGFTAHADRVTGDKETRAGPFAAQAEIGNVCVQRASWNASYLSELAAFPTGTYADQVDASSGAFNNVTQKQYGPPGTVRYA